MAFISLKWFAGMVPRRGNQHLNAPHATEAENCNLYSGELRPLHQPALAHQFCQPTDDCWRQPAPGDPSVPPVEPPEPPNCIPVVANGLIEFSPSVPDPVQGGTVISATVYVNADATPPLQYQWFKNNIAIPGQVEASMFYTVLEGDSYASFTVLVQNPCGQFLSNPITIGAVEFFCRYYACDSLANVIVGTSPDYYYPMNIQSDLDNYPTDPAPIKDYSGAATPPNHLRSQGVSPSPPVAIASTWEADSCSGFMTGAPAGSVMSLDTNEGDIVWGNYSGTSFSAFFQPGDYLAGDRVYFKVEWFNIASATNNGVDVIYNSSNTSMRWQVLSTDQTDSTATNSFDYDFSQVATDWADRMIGIIIYPEGLNLRYELYLDYNVVSTALVPVTGGQTLSKLEADGPPFIIQACGSNAGSQELAIWYRRLNGTELLAMKEALAQNRVEYVDPDPACVPCEVYECDAFAVGLNSIVDHHWPADDDGLPTLDAVGDYDLPAISAMDPFKDSLTGGVCSGVFSSSGAPSDLTAKRNIISEVQGSFGGFFRYVSGGPIMMRLNFGNDSVGIEMRFSGSDVVVEMNDFNSGVNQEATFTNAGATLPDGTFPFIIVNYTITAGVQGEIELFSNFVSQGSVTIPNDLTSSGNNKFINLSNPSSGTYYQNCFYNLAPLTSQEIATLQLAYEQNQTDYVDPNPNCVTPP